MTSADSNENTTENKTDFICQKCSFTSKYHYFGRKPNFLKSVLLMEDAYIIKDPFSSEGGVITIGSHCSLCDKPVCCAETCSLFYTKRFCIDCIKDNIEEFPVEVQQEVLRKHQTDKR